MYDTLFFRFYLQRMSALPVVLWTSGILWKDFVEDFTDIISPHPSTLPYWTTFLSNSDIKLEVEESLFYQFGTHKIATTALPHVKGGN